MTNDNPSIEQNDLLIKAIGKSEALIEEHKESIEDFEEDTEDLEDWLTVFFKAVKNVFL